MTPLETTTDIQTLIHFFFPDTSQSAPLSIEKKLSKSVERKEEKSSAVKVERKRASSDEIPGTSTKAMKVSFG